MLDPHGYLAAVHPDLVKVMQGAYDGSFEIVYGIRTLAAEEEAVATGHSETLHSRHLPDAHFGGKAMAVDIACLDEQGGQITGGIDWSTSDAPGWGGHYGAAANKVLAVAQRLGVKVQWGGALVGAWTDDVKSNFHDFGHFQLDPSVYP